MSDRGCDDHDHSHLYDDETARLVDRIAMYSVCSRDRAYL
jgi:hypothetical protein